MTRKVAFPSWLAAWMKAHGIVLWGAADLRDVSTPRDESGQCFPFAISWVMSISMASIRNGPDQAYADEYTRLNALINRLSQALAAELSNRGFRSCALPASARTDQKNIRGDFPHKTAATRAGLGWIGRNCQLVTRAYGPWVRLGTVFTEVELPCGPPVERDFCGKCVRCVEACPAKALTGNRWHPGMPREELLDAGACDRWKTEHFYRYLEGHVCAICAAVCPHGLKKRTSEIPRQISRKNKEKGDQR